jgi:hypothetical protein
MPVANLDFRTLMRPVLVAATPRALRRRAENRLLTQRRWPQSLNWLRAGLLVMVVAVGVTVTAPAASAKTRLGGIDLQRYCSSTVPQGFDTSKIYLRQNHARGWVCLDAKWIGAPIGWAQVPRSLDLNRACRMQYGKGAYVELEQNHAQGWKCYR